MIIVTTSCFISHNDRGLTAFHFTLCHDNAEMAWPQKGNFRLEFFLRGRFHINIIKVKAVLNSFILDTLWLTHKYKREHVLNLASEASGSKI